MLQKSHEQTTTATEIAALRTTLQSVQRRSQRYHTLVEQAPLGIVLLDAITDRIIDTNRAFQHLTGYADHQLLALKFDEILATPDRNFAEELGKIAPKGASSFQPLQIRHRDGHALPVDISVILPQDKEEGKIIIAIGRNPATQRQSTETIRYHTYLVQSISDAIIATDLSFCIQSWNRAAEELYGMPASEVIGKPFSEILRVEYPGTDRFALLQKLECDGVWKGEQIHRHKDGAQIDILASVSYIWDSQGNRVGIVGINRDITEQKRIERLRLLAEKSEHINLLMSGIAHDFNNMLTSIFSQMSLALRKLPADTPAHLHIEKAIKSAELLADLTRQLRTYTGQSAFQIEAIDLNRLVQDNLGLLETFLPKHTRLELSLVEHVLMIAIDRGQAQQVVMNLVINATEAIQPETGRIFVETGESSLSVPEIAEFKGSERLSPGRYAYLKVSDNGIGMNEATLPRIFEPYFTTKPHGSGLGLSATLGIVQKYQGGLKVESQPGCGTSFTVLFPASQATAAINPAQQTSTAIGASTILVVDDQASVREVVSDILATESIKVISAINGRDGVEKFKQHRSEIHMVLLDMKMPVMNGEETFHVLRALDPHIKILFSSGYNESDVMNQLLRQDSTYFLAKPYSPKALIEMVQSVIEK